ncbi:MAG: hypothetical protein F4W95_04310 [Chloroflexi bacterium]|nr:hypothetical protein [Chloroflexota bacterium]MYD47695.1 hypothetical protein [Chloroflexota bacterium]
MQQHDAMRRTALVLVSIGLVWNVAEAAAGFWAGVEAGSVSLLAFALDSIVELFAGGVLVWRLRAEGEGDDSEAAEQRARRLIGCTFFLLAGYVALHSIASLAGWLPRPEPSLAGVIIVVASALVMAALYVGKMRIAARMQSRALRAEAIESLFCDLQDVAVLLGIGLNALMGWWWADPVAGLLLMPFFIKEGWENFAGDEHGHGHHDDHDDEEESERGHGYLARVVCFCANCIYGLRACRAMCCRA